MECKLANDLNNNLIMQLSKKFQESKESMLALYLFVITVEDERDYIDAISISIGRTKITVFLML